ncbi:MAG: HAD-IA family hydrolase [Propionibacteriaceae bacterium]
MSTSVPIPGGQRPSLWDRTFGAVVFDLDGTLVDSTPAVKRAWTTWAIEHEVTTEQLKGQHGKPSAGVVRSLIPADRHDPAIDRISELELADVHDIVVLPGAAEALAALESARTAIATSCDRPLAAARIAAAGLLAPAVVVTVDDVERGKPHPDPFLEAARRLGVPPECCLVVEDAPAGLAAAHAAGCATLAVQTTTDLADLHADAIVSDLSRVTWTVAADGVRVHPR